MNVSSRDAPLAKSNALSSGGQSTGRQLLALYAKICKLLSISCSRNQTSEFASTKRVRLMYGDCTLIASGIGSTTVSDEIASQFVGVAFKSWQRSCSLGVTPNHALHWTLNQRRFACWFRAGEGKRSGID